MSTSRAGRRAQGSGTPPSCRPTSRQWPRHKWRLRARHRRPTTGRRAHGPSRCRARAGHRRNNGKNNASVAIGRKMDNLYSRNQSCQYEKIFPNSIVVPVLADGRPSRSPYQPKREKKKKAQSGGACAYRCGGDGLRGVLIAVSETVVCGELSNETTSTALSRRASRPF